jgi:hypothetical protein
MARKGAKASKRHGVPQHQIIRVPAPKNFDLGLAVSSYGFFMLAPNEWVKVLHKYL